MIKRLLLLTLLLVPFVCHSEPVGIRSSNPCNLHGYHPDQWEGAVSTDSYNYLRFSSPYWGLRGARRVLQAYATKHNIDTLSQVVHRWVRKPHNDEQRKDLDKYISTLAKRVGVKPTDHLDLMDPYTGALVIKGIIYCENSKQPYKEELFRQVFGY